MSKYLIVTVTAIVFIAAMIFINKLSTRVRASADAYAQYLVDAGRL